MTDYEIIGRAIGQAMQGGQVKNCGHSDGDITEVLMPVGDGFRFYFFFDKATGAATNYTLAEMKAALAEHGVTFE